ncbi:MAG: AAA family ATPase [Planctomycetaceae bacterium]|nr:AAA family ATPase [Planctomycetaceae bacterium]
MHDARSEVIVSEILRDPFILDNGLPAGLQPIHLPDEFSSLALAVVIELRRDGRPVNFPTVYERGAEAYPESRFATEGWQWLLDLQKYPASAMPRAYADELLAEFNRRRTEALIADLHAAATDGTTDHDTLLTRLRAVAEEAEKSSSGSRFKFLTADDLEAADLRIDWLIRGLIVRGQCGGLYGPSKGCKTTLLVALGYSVSSGIPLFGEFEVSTPGRVLMMSSESGLATIRDICRRLSIASGVNYRDLPIQFCDEVPRLTNVADVLAVERAIRDFRADVVLLDPFYHMAGDASDDMSNLAAMGRVLSQLTMMSRHTGATVLMAHHLRKHIIPGEPAALTDIQGSGHDAFARQWILVNRRTAYDPSVGRHELWLNCGGSAGHGRLLAVDINEGVLNDDGSGRTWEVSVSEPRDARQAASGDREAARQTERWQREQATLRANVNKVIDAYKTQAEPRTANFLKSRARVNGTVFSEANALLVDCGAVIESQAMVHTRMETVFRLTEGWPEAAATLQVFTESGVSDAAE